MNKAWIRDQSFKSILNIRVSHAYFICIPAGAWSLKFLRSDHENGIYKLSSVTASTVRPRYTPCVRTQDGHKRDQWNLSPSKKLTVILAILSELSQFLRARA